MDLSLAECRVLGCLIEKEATVPDTYPMTLNALRTGCNQKSSRDPVLDLSESEVTQAADGLRDKRLVRLVHQPGGRASKFRHRIDDELVLDEPSLAVLSVLLLRGPQTVGELRSRTERQFAFDDLDAVAHVLERLAGRDDPLVQILPRVPGQKDRRWIHLMSSEGPEQPRAEQQRPDRVSQLEDRVAALESMLSSLAAELGLELDDLPPGADGS